jgi:hypothetical protein
MGDTLKGVLGFYRPFAVCSLRGGRLGAPQHARRWIIATFGVGSLLTALKRNITRFLNSFPEPGLSLVPVAAVSGALESGRDPCIAVRRLRDGRCEMDINWLTTIKRQMYRARASKS